MELQHTNPDGSVVTVEYERGRFTMNPSRTPTIDPTATLGEAVSLLSNDVFIGFKSRIGSRVVIGEHSTIDENVTIRDDVVIGDYTGVRSNVIVDATVNIGKHVTVARTTHIPANWEIPSYSVANPGNNGTPVVTADIEAALDDLTPFGK